MQEIGCGPRFQATPKETHVQEVKIIFIYLEATLDFGLWYSRGEYFTLNEFTNANWEGNVDDRKSTSGGAIFLGKHSSVLVEQETLLSFFVQKIS
jgi:hypothetical protein